jgi:hypothetical protein
MVKNKEFPRKQRNYRGIFAWVPKTGLVGLQEPHFLRPYLAHLNCDHSLPLTELSNTTISPLSLQRQAHIWYQFTSISESRTMEGQDQSWHCIVHSAAQGSWICVGMVWKSTSDYVSAASEVILQSAYSRRFKFDSAWQIFRRFWEIIENYLVIISKVS